MSAVRLYTLGLPCTAHPIVKVRRYIVEETSLLSGWPSTVLLRASLAVRKGWHTTVSLEGLTTYPCDAGLKKHVVSVSNRQCLEESYRP